jgi:hypothetical protein
MNQNGHDGMIEQEQDGRIDPLTAVAVGLIVTVGVLLAGLVWSAFGGSNSNNNADQNAQPDHDG